MSTPLFAQIEITLTLEHEAYLRHENVNAVAAIVNKGQRALRVTTDGPIRDSISFTIIKGRDNFIDPSSRKSIVSDLQLEPGEKRDILINLTEHYDLTADGRYMITLNVHHFGKTYASNNQMIDIVAGIDMKAASGSVYGFPEEIRKFQLKYWGRGGAEEAFMMVTDEADTKCYGVFGLGRIVRVTEPLLTFDKYNNLYSVHQQTKDCYIRSKFVVEKNSVRLEDQDYLLPNGDPFPRPGSKVDAVAEKAVSADVSGKGTGKSKAATAAGPGGSSVEKPGPQKKGKPSLFYFRKSEGDK